MKTYIGTYDDGDEWTVVVEEDGARRPLDPCNDVMNHSPDGLAWGYGGSGPAQLALALMCDLFGKPTPDMEINPFGISKNSLHPIHYQQLKFHWVAGLPFNGSWRVTEAELRDRIRALEHAK